MWTEGVLCIHKIYKKKTNFIFIENVSCIVLFHAVPASAHLNNLLLLVNVVHSV